MNVIYRIWQRFYNALNKTNNKSKLSNNTEHSAGIVFRLSSDLQMEIGCVFPDIKNLSIDEIADLAEKYAELLIMINSGMFKNQIFDMIKSQVKLSDNDSKEQLFVENVLSFDKIITHELNRAAKYNKPLIRPVSVFKN